MENNVNMNNQVNETNNVQEEKKNNNKTIGIVVLIIGLLLVGLAVYKLFIEKPEIDKPKDDNTQENGNNNVDNYSVSKFEIVDITEDMEDYKLTNGKVLKLNVGTIDEGNHLYLDNVKIDHEVYINETLLVTDKYIVGFEGLPCGVKASFAFDYEGKDINIEEKYHDLDNNDYSGQCKEAGIILETTDMKIENGNLIAYVIYFDKNESESKQKVEFSYNSAGIVVQKVN